MLRVQVAANCPEAPKEASRRSLCQIKPKKMSSEQEHSQQSTAPAAETGKPKKLGRKPPASSAAGKRKNSQVVVTHRKLVAAQKDSNRPILQKAPVEKALRQALLNIDSSQFGGRRKVAYRLSAEMKRQLFAVLESQLLELLRDSNNQMRMYHPGKPTLSGKHIAFRLSVNPKVTVPVSMKNRSG
jgi:hypothetical protein